MDFTDERRAEAAPASALFPDIAGEYFSAASTA
jgi:hypothetical protein